MSLKHEKYYWEKQDGTLIPVDELTNLHIFHIVAKFGKDWLNQNNHYLIVSKFDALMSDLRIKQLIESADKIHNGNLQFVTRCTADSPAEGFTTTEIAEFFENLAKDFSDDE